MDDRASVSQVRMQQWANIIRNQKESGLTIDAFCEANNISKNRFFYWQKKIRETAIQAVGNRFVEVTTPVNNHSDEFFPKSGCIGISLNDAVLTVDNNVSTELLARVIGVLKNA